MAEVWFDLSSTDRGDVLDLAADQTGRAVHLLEKDIWVVWVLSAIYGSDLADDVTFKGGTSLSKVYKIIDRFSEDVDLTYDIRQLVPDLLDPDEPVPSSSSKGETVAAAVRKRLPNWIQSDLVPVIEIAKAELNFDLSLDIDDDNRDKLIISYPALRTGTGYAAPTIQLEFGARATGEPNNLHDVACDAAVVDSVAFPTATPLVMKAERTFWEKATLAHVFCLQGRMRGSDRFSRHWYDLAAFTKSGYFEPAVTDQQLATQVAYHKSIFFKENDSAGNRIDYQRAVDGDIQLVPTGESLDRLQGDYEAMIKDGLLENDPPTFAEILERSDEIERRING